nr:MAG TPA: YopX protein [Caudoviricetes sp.]
MTPKFRAWLKEEKRMTDVREMTFMDGEVYFISDITDFYAYEEFKLMQSTGLKDKNGRDIYEGDVVRYECCFESYVEEVIYDDKHCNFGTIDKDEKTFSFDALISDFDVDCFEVVGNKYENLELLGE